MVVSQDVTFDEGVAGNFEGESKKSDTNVVDIGDIIKIETPIGGDSESITPTEKPPANVKVVNQVLKVKILKLVLKRLVATIKFRHQIRMTVATQL